MACKDLSQTSCGRMDYLISVQIYPPLLLHRIVGEALIPRRYVAKEEVSLYVLRAAIALSKSQKYQENNTFHQHPDFAGLALQKSALICAPFE